MKKKKTMNGRCTNCGKAIEQESNENWKVYCTDKKCSEAFMNNVLKKVK